MGDQQMIDEEELRALFAQYQNGRFSIRRILGAGAMGTVVQAFDNRLKKLRAIKVFNPEFNELQELRDRFEIEAASMAQIDCDYIVRVYDTFEIAEFRFIILEWVDGGSLNDHLNAFGPMFPRQAVSVALSICKALSKTHVLGIIHRDIKPGNILLTRTGVVKVADFGIAHVNTAEALQLTGTKQTLGTMGYMPLEQGMDAGKVDQRADVHATAVTLWQMLTGKQPKVFPFHGIVDLPETFECVPDVLHAVLKKAVALAAQDRFQTIDAFAEALSVAFDKLPAVPDLVPPLGSAIKPKPEDEVQGISTPLPTHASAMPEPTKVSDSWGKHATKGEPTPLPDTGVGRTRGYDAKGTALGIGAPASSPKVPVVELPLLAKERDGERSASSSFSKKRSFPFSIAMIVLAAIAVGVGAFLFWPHPQTNKVSVPAFVPASALAVSNVIADAITIAVDTNEPASADILIAAAPSTDVTVAQEVSEPTPSVIVVEVTKKKSGKEEVKKEKKTQKSIILKAGDQITLPVASTDKKVRIDLQGDGASVWITGLPGKIKLPASVSPGIYRVSAKFEGENDESVVIKRLEVVESSIKITCQSAFSGCSAQ